jgi:hypothetical protein
MGFPNGYKFAKQRENQGDMTDRKECFRIVGNAVCPPLIAALAAATLEHCVLKAPATNWTQKGHNMAFHLAKAATRETRAPGCLEERIDSDGIGIDALQPSRLALSWRSLWYPRYIPVISKQSGKELHDRRATRCALQIIAPILRDFLDGQVFVVGHVNAVDPRGVMEFKGGETAASERVKDYICVTDLLKDYFDTLNGMIGADNPTKFAPWLAHGCVSPRYIAKECRRYEKNRVANKSTYWVVFKLL